MTKVDQLIAKAMSTSSEEEAIACLKFARKEAGKSGYTQTQTKTQTANSNTILDLQYKLRIAQNLYLEANQRGDYFMKEMTKAQIDREKYRTLYNNEKTSKGFFKMLLASSIVFASVCLMGIAVLLV